MAPGARCSHSQQKIYIFFFLFQIFRYFKAAAFARKKLSFIYSETRGFYYFFLGIVIWMVEHLMGLWGLSAAYRCAPVPVWLRGRVKSDNCSFLMSPVFCFYAPPSFGLPACLPAWEQGSPPAFPPGGRQCLRTCFHFCKTRDIWSLSHLFLFFF